MNTSRVVPAAAAFASMFLAGCGGSGSNSFNGASGSPVGDNPRGIVPWAGIQGESNVAATMRVNDSGTQVTQIPATIVSATIQDINLGGIMENGVEDLYCQPGDGRKIYEGDSGSPVLIGGNIAGGLFGTSDNVHFDARGIQQEMGTGGGPPLANIVNAGAVIRRLRPLSRARFFEGNRSLLPLIRTKPGFGNTVYIERPLKASPEASGPVPPLPGRRFAAPFVIGPYVIGFDEAAYTIELPDGRWIGTAHGLEDAGPVSWPVMSVFVDFLGSDGAVHGHVIGSIFGTIQYDGQKGSLIDPSHVPSMMPITVDTTLNLAPQAPVLHRARFDLGSSTEDESIRLAIESTLEAQLQNSGNSVTASGRIVLTMNGRQFGSDLHFGGGLTQSAFISQLDSQLTIVLNDEKGAFPGEQVTNVSAGFTISA